MKTLMYGLVCHHLRVYCAVLLLGVASVLSAAMIAPERADATDIQIALLGLSADDICGDVSTHDHRCPYCHLVPHTPIPSAVEVESLVVFMMAWKRATDLYRAAQARDHDRSPRAPPCIV